MLKNYVQLALPHLSKASSFLLSHLFLRAYFNILSEASIEVTSNPSSSNIMESILQSKNILLIWNKAIKINKSINLVTVVTVFIYINNISYPVPQARSKTVLQFLLRNRSVMKLR